MVANRSFLKPVAILQIEGGTSIHKLRLEKDNFFLLVKHVSDGITLYLVEGKVLGGDAQSPPAIPQAWCQADSFPPRGGHIMEQTNMAPLEYLEQRLRRGETLHLGPAALWYQPTQRLFFLKIGDGSLTAGPLDRQLWSLLNTLGTFQPHSAQEEHSDLYTISSSDQSSPL